MPVAAALLCCEAALLSAEGLNPDTGSCFSQSQSCPLTQGVMIVRESGTALPRLVLALALTALGCGVSGCADMGENMTTAFADPAKYELYDCKQLETERKNLSVRGAELQGLIDKAETGTGGAIVAELAY